MRKANPFGDLVQRFARKVRNGVGLLILANFCLLFYLTPAAFQSLGTVWISVAIFSFMSWRYLSHQLRLGFENKGLVAGVVDEFMDKASIRQKKGWLNYITKEGRPIPNPPEFSEEQVKEFIEEAITEIDGQVFGPEVTLLVVGTLQSGYGAMLSSWIN
jgi:hypothetical protein